MASRSSAGQAVGSVLGTVTTAATAVTSLFSAVGTGATMLQRYADDASTDQADASKIHRKVYRSNLVTNAALEQSKLQAEVTAHLSSLDDQSKATFESVHKELSSLFAEA